MNLTFILHFDASKIADPVLAKSQYLAINDYCRSHKYNLLAREDFYHDESWLWSKQTLKLAYDYLWGDFDSDKNGIDGVVIVTLDEELALLTEYLKNPEPNVFPFAGVSFLARNDLIKQGLSHYLGATA